MQGKRHAPRPLILALVVGVRNTCDKDTTDRPRHLKRSCASTAKSERDHFTGVGGSVGDEKAPRYSLESLTDDEDLKRVGLRTYSQTRCIYPTHFPTYEEGDEDRSVHEDQAKNGRPAVSEDVCDRTGHEDTDKCTALTGLEEGRLPFCLYGVNRRHDAGVGNEHAISLLEVLECDEVAVQEHVEGFHDTVNALVWTLVHSRLFVVPDYDVVAAR